MDKVKAQTPLVGPPYKRGQGLSLEKGVMDWIKRVKIKNHKNKQINNNNKKEHTHPIIRCKE